MSGNRGRRVVRVQVKNDLYVAALRKAFDKPDAIFLVQTNCHKCFERGFTAFRQTRHGRRVVPCSCLLIGRNGKPKEGRGNEKQAVDSRAEEA